MNFLSDWQLAASTEAQKTAYCFLAFAFLSVNGEDKTAKELTGWGNDSDVTH